MKQGMGHRMSLQVPELSPTREQEHASLCGLGILLFQMTVKQNVCSLRGRLERKGMPVCTPSYDIYTSTCACMCMRAHACAPPPHSTTHSWWMECIHPVPCQLYQLHVPPLVLIATVCMWDTHEDMTAC